MCFSICNSIPGASFDLARDPRWFALNVRGLTPLPAESANMPLCVSIGV